MGSPNDVCDACGEEIDDTTCWCGAPIEGQDWHDNHTTVPDGCRCHRDKDDLDVATFMERNLGDVEISDE